MAAPLGGRSLAGPLMAGALVCAAAAARRRQLVVIGAAVALVLGLARAELARPEPSTWQRARAHAGERISATGTVLEDPRPSGSGTEVLIAVDRVGDAAGALPSIGNLAVHLRGPASVQEGTPVAVSGRLRLPSRTPSFDRGAYLSQKGIYLELAPATLRAIGDPVGPGHWPAALRSGYRAAVDERLPPPHSAVLVGTVLGVRTGIPPRLRQALIDTGLVHLLVLSGLKVALVSRLLLGAGRPLMGRAAIAPVMLLIGVYALAGGATAAALRAAAMGGLVLLAEMLGRPVHVWTSLTVVGSAMLAWRPGLIFDTGFQLSFVGTAAIILLTPLIEARIRRVPRFLAEPFAVTCAAQVGTAPLMAADFHVLSPVAPFANAAVLPLLPAIVLLGLLLPPVAVVPGLGAVVVALVTGLLTYLEQVALLLARLPGAAIAVPGFPPGAAAAYFVMLGAGVGAWRGPRRWRPVALAAGAGAPLLVACGALALMLRPEPSVAFLAVGAGQSELFRSARTSILVDGGADPGRLAGELGSRLPPWTAAIDAVAITGAAPGGGLEGLRHPAREVLVPAGGEEASSLRRVVLDLAARGGRVRRLLAGDRLTVGDFHIDVLAPEATATAEPGASGLALRVTGPSGRSACEMGGLDPDAQRSAADRLTGRCDYLLLTDGGRSAPPPELLNRARPRSIILSAGPGARTAAGLPVTLLMRTAEEGTIELPL